jgi:hypothetical protein
MKKVRYCVTIKERTEKRPPKKLEFASLEERHAKIMEAAEYAIQKHQAVIKAPAKLITCVAVEAIRGGDCL